MEADILIRYTQAGLDTLRTEDPVLFGLLSREAQRQREVLMLVAASSVADPSVLTAEGMPTGNVTAEGYPGKRYHAGCEVVDELEQLAIRRARTAFRAQYANVQPHSGSSANQIVMYALLRPGDTILGMDLDAGGHLTHGAKPSASSKFFKAVRYGLNSNGRIDYAQVDRLAQAHRPKLIICGASAYTRIIDFSRFREIAERNGAYLMADISHIAGLVVAGVHPSPIDQAHFTTTSTYKQLYGPRGGLILMGKDHLEMASDGKTTLAELIQRGTFPFFQGTPNLSAIAAKAAALARACRPEFGLLMEQIVVNARALSTRFEAKGYRVISGGTDNHALLIDLSPTGITGWVAEKSLEVCGIVINKNRIPGDLRPATITSGIRLGTNTVTLRGMGSQQMQACADLIHQVLSGTEALGERAYRLDERSKRDASSAVSDLCRTFPLPAHPE